MREWRLGYLPLPKSVGVKVLRSLYRGVTRLALHPYSGNTVKDLERDGTFVATSGDSVRERQARGRLRLIDGANKCSEYMRQGDSPRLALRTLYRTNILCEEKRRPALFLLAMKRSGR